MGMLSTLELEDNYPPLLVLDGADGAVSVVGWLITALLELLAPRVIVRVGTAAAPFSAALT